jgi:hypothetical protein
MMRLFVILLSAIALSSAYTTTDCIADIETYLECKATQVALTNCVESQSWCPACSTPFFDYSTCTCTMMLDAVNKTSCISSCEMLLYCKVQNNSDGSCSSEETAYADCTKNAS